MLSLLLAMSLLAPDASSPRLDVDRLLEASFLGQLKAPPKVRQARAAELRAQLGSASATQRALLERVLQLVEQDLTPAQAVPELRLVLRELQGLARGTFDLELSVGRGLDSLVEVATKAAVDPVPLRAEALAWAREVAARSPGEARAHALLGAALFAAGEGSGPVLSEFKRCVELGSVPRCRSRHAELVAHFERVEHRKVAAALRLP